MIHNYYFSPSLFIDNHKTLKKHKNNNCRILFLLIMLLISSIFYSQNSLITTSDGGFENTTSAFSNNGWTQVGTSGRTWRVGTFGGAATGTKAAYWGTATAYGGNANTAVGHFYRDITIPAGATNVYLNYKLKYPTVDNTYDYFYVFTTSNSNTPVNGTIPTTGYTQQFVNTATTYSAFTSMPQIDLSAFAGTTIRLVFTFKSDAFAPNAAPAIDDITLTYLTATPCSGTPNAGTASISSTNGCANTSVNLNASNLSAGTGITYQWQSSSDNIVWNNITGATNSSYNITTSTGTTYYKLVTTCSNSSNSNSSNSVSFNGTNCLSVNVPTTSYNTIPCGSSSFIYDNGGTSGNYATSSNGYTVIENSGTGIISLTGNYTYIESSYDYLKIYSGIGTGGTLLATYSSNSTGTITPITSSAGQSLTVLFTSDGSNEGAGFALLALYSGTCATCFSPSGLATSNITTNSSTISWTPPTIAPLNGYEYYYSTNSTAPTSSTTPSGNVLTGNSSITLTGLTPSTTYYFWVRSNCGNGDKSSWTSNISFTTQIAPIIITPASNTTFCNGDSVSLTASSAVGYTYTWSPNIGLNSSTGATIIASPTSTTTYTVTGTSGSTSTTNTITITINSTPTDVEISNSNSTICSNSIQTLTATGGIVTTNILFENFNGTAPGWTTINNSTGGTIANAAWALYYSGSTFYSNDNTNFVMSDSDAQNSGTTATQLISPTFNLIGYTSATLQFFHHYNNNSDDTARVQISTDGGSSYTNLITYNNDQGTETGFVLASINLDAYVGLSNLKIRFKYDATWDWYWAIDNLVLSASKQNIVWSPNTNLFTDVACTIAYDGISNAPTLYARPTESINYTATSTNNGCIKSDTVNFNIQSVFYNPNLYSNNTPANWSEAPSNNKSIIFDGGNFTSTEDIEACSCTINSGDVIITTGHTLKLHNELNVNGGSITFQDKASLVQINNNAINTGNIYYSRNAIDYTSALYDYVYWSTPTTNSSTAAVGCYSWNTTYVNTNGTQGNWSSANNTSMTTGKGYIMRDVFSKTFNGIPHNGIITTNVQRGTITTGPNKDTDNWNLIGNPYPSAIDSHLFMLSNTNIEGSIAVWTHNTSPSSANGNPFYANFVSNYQSNDYIIYNLTGSQAGPHVFEGDIAAGQGFMVKLLETGSNSQTIEFNNSMRGDNNNQFFRQQLKTIENQNTIINPESHRIWLEITNSNLQATRTLIGYIEGATNNQDRLFDATTSSSNDQKIYSLINQDKFAIQGRELPFNDQDIIPIGYDSPVSGTYIIAINAVDGLFNNQNIYLEDILTNTIHNLTLSPYSFNTSSGSYTDRFRIRFNNSTLENEDFITNNENLLVYVNENINIKSTDKTIKSIQIFDLLGRNVATYDTINNTFFTIENLKATKATLLIRVTLENGQTKPYKIIF